MIFISESNDQSWCNIIHGCFFPLLSTCSSCNPFSSIPLSLFVSVTYVFTRFSIYSLILYIGCISFLECIFEILYLWNENESFDFFSYIIVIIFHFWWFCICRITIFGALGISFFFLNYIGKILLCNNNFIIISQCIQCLVSLKNYLIKFYLMCFFLSFFYYYSSCIGAKFFRKVSKHPVYHVHFEQR